MEAALVNVIWASTFVLIKIGLNGLGPLTLGGLRYFGGFVLLLPLLARNAAATPRARSPRVWLKLVLIGVSSYALGNGALFWGLQFMPATTGSFLLGLVPLPVLFLGIVWLKEIPRRRQIAGMRVVLVGGALFFSPGLRAGAPQAIGVVTAGLVGFALFGIWGREVARDQLVDTLSLTAFPLAFGGGLLLLIALGVEGLPRFSAQSLVVVLWLAAVNTALAYVVYNHSLQVLTAFEMNVMMSLAPLITAVIAWVLLGERSDPLQIVGMTIVVIGVALVQWSG